MSEIGGVLLKMGQRRWQLWRWPRCDRRLFLEAVRLAVCIEIELRMFPFTRVLARLNAEPVGRSNADSPISAASVLQAIQRAYGVLPFESTCLRESLIFCRIFKRRGLPAELRIGVRKAGDHLDAHAWVEDGKGTLLTDPLERFVTLPLPGHWQDG
jgi:hypothetical protein